MDETACGGWRGGLRKRLVDGAFSLSLAAPVANANDVPPPLPCRFGVRVGCPLLPPPAPPPLILQSIVVVTEDPWWDRCRGVLGLYNILDRYSRYLRTSTYVQK